MQLSPHFWLREFTRSELAVRHGVDNTPSEGVVFFLRELCTTVLEPIRTHVCAVIGRDVSIYITSGYRSPRVNELAKGSKNSDHLHGRAADMVGVGVPLKQFALLAREACETLMVKQCIVEFDEWVHVSSDIRRPPRREFLVATYSTNGVVYTPWSGGGLA